VYPQALALAILELLLPIWWVQPLRVVYPS